MMKIQINVPIIFMGQGSRKAKQAKIPAISNGPANSSSIPPNRRIFVGKKLLAIKAIT
ncbi:hypothetical protein [Citrobacter braakii]|uniref:Uncharacterized protein n=1 Tax=Citrobacter braakii TaxID=57706 RepID=A0A8I0G3X3_CITBR|nr:MULTISPECIES: hypothetical protein [Citrobacter]MBD3123566.1 hypothetical protein [Citrobacter braakii]MDM3385811.1 hypothetical protein [Citrobacter sp. Cb011]MDM3422943.1 hypothetical protein [Citrobacter sp. Cb025]MDM3441056.1 hypothetical protein [Citrobacter sp. Cb063]MEB7706963.1 hypothetical protein [Citrobacter braakii]